MAEIEGLISRCPVCNWGLIPTNSYVVCTGNPVMKGRGGYILNGEVQEECFCAGRLLDGLTGLVLDKNEKLGKIFL